MRYGAPEWMADGVGIIAAAAFVLMTAGYLVKLATAPRAVLAGFRHPTSGNLFGTALVSLLLLPIIVAPVDLRLAQVMWSIGAGW